MAQVLLRGQMVFRFWMWKVADSFVMIRNDMRLEGQVFVDLVNVFFNKWFSSSAVNEDWDWSGRVIFWWNIWKICSIMGGNDGI